jgi:hypothetical protein
MLSIDNVLLSIENRSISNVPVVLLLLLGILSSLRDNHLSFLLFFFHFLTVELLPESLLLKLLEFGKFLLRIDDSLIQSSLFLRLLLIDVDKWLLFGLTIIVTTSYRLVQHLSSLLSLKCNSSHFSSSTFLCA